MHVLLWDRDVQLLLVEVEFHRCVRHARTDINACVCALIRCVRQLREVDAEAFEHLARETGARVLAFMRRGEAHALARDVVVVDRNVDRVDAWRHDVATPKARHVDPLRVDLQESRIELDSAARFGRTRGARAHESRHRERGQYDGRNGIQHERTSCCTSRALRLALA